MVDLAARQADILQLPVTQVLQREPGVLAPLLKRMPILPRGPRMPRVDAAAGPAAFLSDKALSSAAADALRRAANAWSTALFADTMESLGTRFAASPSIPG